MNLLEEYKKHLLTKKKKASKNTIKNYVSDVRSFISWLEEKQNFKFNAKKISLETINIYKSYLIRSNTSLASIDRYLSSLRSFFEFLKVRSVILQSPFEDEVPAIKLSKDDFLLNEFKLNLLSANLSKVTVKNYLMDIKQFLNWLENVSGISQDQYSGIELLKNIDDIVINEYKNRLFEGAHLSPSSINRKLSSLRKYLTWIGKKDIKINKIPSKINTEKITDNKSDQLSISQNIDLQDNHKLHENFNQIKTSNYPILLKLPLNLISMLYEAIIITPLSNSVDKFHEISWILKGKNIFIKPNIFNLSKNMKVHKINNIPKSIYAPWHKKIYHHLRYSRPKWYKIYHSFNFTSYLHLGVLIIFTCFCGFTIYYSFHNGLLTQKAVFASPSSATPKTLTVAGTLSDQKNNPITTITALRFSIYDDLFATGSALLWQEVQTVSPNIEGKFSTILGRENTLPSSIFSDNPSVYLGMTVGADKELAPRQQLATVSYSGNSKMLQGLKPITQTGAGTSNVVLALDSAGNLTIGGNASPIFEAAGGKFTISGITLLLTTATDTNTNIEISPDGIGMIDMQKPIQNTSNNNNIPSAAGAVEVDDLFAILATSSGQSAFTINQNSTGPIISASAGGIAKFTLENDGSGLFAGNLAINGQNLTSLSTSFNLLSSATSISIASSSGFTSINNTLIASGGLTVPLNRSLIVSGNIASDLLPYVTGSYNLGSPTLHWNSAYLDNLYISPAASGEADLFTASSSGLSRFVIRKNGDVGIAGSLCVGANSGACAGNTPGTIYSVNTTLQNADVAENYISSEHLEPGDIIMPEGKGNPLAIIKTSRQYEANSIGVVSSMPGITLNSQAAPDLSHAYLYPIALSGRVPVKVSIQNGHILAGDYITASSIPGVGMKATGRGISIGKALENYDNPDAKEQGKIEVFINLSYFDTSTGYTEKYNPEYNPLLYNIKIGFLQAQNTITDSLNITSENIKIGGQNLQEYIAQEVQNKLDQINHRESAINLVSPISSSSAQPSTMTSLSPTPQVLTQTEADNSATISAILTDISKSLDSSTSAKPGTDWYLASASSQLISSVSANLDNQTASASSSPTLKSQLSTLKSPNATGSAQIDNQGFVELISKNQKLSNDFTNLSTFSAQFENSPHFSSLISDFSLLSDVAISGNFNVGGNLIIAKNAINTIGSDLELEPLRQGNLSIMGDLVTIDTGGNLKVNANASFAKDVTVKGTLTTNIIAPVPEEDLVIKLGDSKNQDSQLSTLNSQLSIHNASGSAVLAVNQSGDIVSSGSGSFANIESKGLTIVRQAQADTSLVETVASSSAGIALITRYETERTIISPFVTADSLIYLTAASDTQGLTPYIARQTPNSFTIAIPYPINKDIKVNWWIIN